MCKHNSLSRAEDWEIIGSSIMLICNDCYKLLRVNTVTLIDILELEKRIIDEAKKVMSKALEEINKVTNFFGIFEYPFFVDGVKDFLIYDKKIGKFTKVKYQLSTKKVSNQFKQYSYSGGIKMIDIKL